MYVFRQKNHLGGERGFSPVGSTPCWEATAQGFNSRFAQKNLLTRPMSKAQLGSGSGNGPQLWTGLLTSNGPLYTGGVGVQRFSRYV